MPACRAAILILANVLAAHGAGAAEKLRVAKSEATTFAFALLDVGIAEGMFAKHGLEIESLDLAGSGKAHQALEARDTTGTTILLP